MAKSKSVRADRTMILNRKDGWNNTFAGLGKKGDKTKATYFGNFDYIQDSELTNMWMGEGLGKKIVSCVADDMTRAWIKIEGDTNNKIQTELSRLNTKQTVNRAVKWARLYRGSIIVVGYNDGGKLEDPLNPARIRGIDWVKDYAAPRIQNVQSDLVTDPTSPYFEDFSYFKVFKTDGSTMQVHRSRCLVFKGEPVPHLLHGVNFYYLYWGMSVLQSILQQVKDIGAISQGVSNLMYEVVIGKYKLSNLAEILSSNNTEAIYNRMEIINASKSLINGVLLGEGEEYTRDTVNLTGIPDTMDRFMMLLSAVSEIPMTRLFGRSPAGMNATGESDLRNYYDMVSSKQENMLLNPLQQLVDGVNTYAKVSGTPTIKFESIWQPTQSEIVKMRMDQSTTDKTYVEMGVLDPDEVRKSRFEGGYNIETTLMSEDEIALVNKSEVPGENTKESDIKEEGQTGNVQKKPGTETPKIKKQPGPTTGK